MGGQRRGVEESGSPRRASLPLEGFELFAEGHGQAPPHPIATVHAGHLRRGHCVQNGFPGESQGVGELGGAGAQMSGAGA